MAFSNPWEMAVLAWEAVCVLWIVTVGLDMREPEGRDWLRAGSVNTVYTALLGVGAALLFWNDLAIAPLGRTIFHAPRAGVVLTYLGVAFAGLARLSLGTNWSSRARIRTGHTLATAGPYRIVRHPIYSGLLLGYLGTAMVLGEVRGYMGFGVAFVAWWLRSRLEDKLLAERFGPQFDAYRRRTRAIIPGVL